MKLAALARPGALGLYCLSCVTMAAMGVAALAVAVGVAGARPLATPLDGFLSAWGLPLLVASVAALLWTMRRAPRPALALVAAGGLLTLAGMVGMGPPSTPTSPGMAAMGGMQGPSAAVPVGVALLFWAGAVLLAAGYVWAWRARRAGMRGSSSVSLMG